MTIETKIAELKAEMKKLIREGDAIADEKRAEHAVKLQAVASKLIATMGE